MKKCITSAAIAVMATVAFMSCSNNPIAPDSTIGEVKLSIQGFNANGPASPAVLAKTAQGDLLTVTSAKVVIAKVELENETNSALDFKLDQPFVQDLVTLTTLQEIQTVEIPFGTYDKVKLEIDDLDNEDGDVFTQNPDLQNLSVRVQGFLNGNTAETFEFTSDLSVNIELEFDTPIEIDEQLLSTNIVLGIDLGQWFLDRNNTFLDPSIPQNQERIEDNIKRSFQVFEDKDEDGKRDSDDEDIEIKGTIESLGGDHLVVSGKTFLIDDQTKVIDNNENQIPFGDLQEGLFVEVHAIETNGTLIATKIKVEDDNGDDEEEDNDNEDDEVKGAITELGTEMGVDSLVVKDRTFFVDNTTVIKGDNGQDLSFGELKVGMVVEVHAVQRADQTWLATKIEVEDDNDDDSNKGD